MKTGKMKKGIYIITIAALAGLTAAAGPVKKIASAKTVLPVAMYINAVAVNSAGEVSWEAAKQISVRRYELEKSTDGQNFSYVTALAGNNKIIKANYTAQDRNLIDGINYYRLKMINNNGSIHYSKIISLDKKAIDARIKIMPGAVAAELYIWLPANTQISNAVITDLTGRKVMANTEITHFTNVASVQLGRLPAGMYKINVVTNTGVTANLKFSKK